MAKRDKFLVNLSSGGVGSVGLQKLGRAFLVVGKSDNSVESTSCLLISGD